MNALIVVLPAGLLAVYGLAIALWYRGRESTARVLYGLAWAESLVLLVCNGLAAQAPPVGNMHHVMCLFPVVMGPMYVFAARVQKLAWLLPYFAGACALALAGALCMPFQASWRQMPALQSPWFVPHVTAYVLSYGLMTVATLLALMSFIRKTEAARYLNAAHGAVKLGFPLMSFGLWSGAVWADAAWSGYWAWDIKEAWSLVTWGLYVVYFHFVRLPGWNRACRAVLLAAFAALIVTFLVVNLLPKLDSMHSYAM